MAGSADAYLRVLHEAVCRVSQMSRRGCLTTVTAQYLYGFIVGGYGDSE